MNNFEKLSMGILSLSESKDWSTAKKEWLLDSIEFNDIGTTCLCGHNPIIECCYIKNIFNNNKAMVGNCCVKKFMDLPSDKIFKGIKKIKVDIEDKLNPEGIEYAFDKGLVNEWELNFYKNVWRKWKLSEKQKDKMIQINNKILENLSKTSEKINNAPDRSISLYDIDLDPFWE